MKRTANDPIQDVKIVNGLPVYIEWPKGSTRTYKRSGTQVLMYADYGYIPKTEGADGEELDVYLGEDLDSPYIFQLHQKDKDNEAYDENKYMVGFKSAEEAKEIYLKHVPEDRFGGIKEMTWDQFKNLLKNNVQKQAKEVKLDDSHLKKDIQDFNSLENKIEDMKNEDKQELKKQSGELTTPPPWYYEPDSPNDPPESKYRVGQQVLLDNYMIGPTYENKSDEGKILEAIFEEGAWNYKVELSPGDEVWASEDDINSVKTASRRQAMRKRALNLNEIHEGDRVQHPRWDTGTVHSIGFLFGAGSSFATGIPSTRVPAVAEMTIMIVSEVEKCSEIFAAAINEIRAEIGDELFNIESLLSSIEAKRAVIGCGTLNGLNSSDFAELATCVKGHVVNLVSIHKTLKPEDRSNLAHSKLSSWVSKARRSFPAEIFTTNYDYLFEIALEGSGIPYFDGFSGSYEPFFCPEAVEDVDGYIAFGEAVEDARFSRLDIP